MTPNISQSLVDSVLDGCIQHGGCSSPEEQVQLLTTLASKALFRAFDAMVATERTGEEVLAYVVGFFLSSMCGGLEDI